MVRLFSLSVFRESVACWGHEIQAPMGGQPWRRRGAFRRRTTAWLGKMDGVINPVINGPDQKMSVWIVFRIYTIYRVVDSPDQ